jgi:prepilin-type N-terminal cleavage/methylation domain-containing protein
MNKKMKNKTGFTLIELLVVIAIIAIITSIVITNLNEARNKANIANNAEIAFQWRNAMALCVDNRNGNWPTETINGDNLDINAGGDPVCMDAPEGTDCTILGVTITEDDAIDCAADYSDTPVPITDYFPSAVAVSETNGLFFNIAHAQASATTRVSGTTQGVSYHYDGSTELGVQTYQGPGDSIATVEATTGNPVTSNFNGS